MNFDLNDIRQVHVVLIADSILAATLLKAVTDILTFNALGDPKIQSYTCCNAADPNDQSTHIHLFPSSGASASAALLRARHG
ncbi:MAG: hypothetical protein ABJN52_16930 [Litorimonas sp.]